MPTPMYHIAASGRAVRCPAKIRCKLQHLDEAGKRDYDALFQDMFSPTAAPKKRGLLPRRESARALWQLPQHNATGYAAAADAYHRGLSEQDRWELTRYTESPGINNYLRDPDLSFKRGEVTRRGQLGAGAADRVAGLDAAIAKGGFKEPVAVFRGVEVDDVSLLREQLADRYVVGGEVSFPEYLSTSVDPAVAISFATNHGRGSSVSYQPVLFRISTTEGAPVDVLTNAPVDREVILPRGKRFRVVGVSRELVQNRTIQVGMFDAMNPDANQIQAGPDLHGFVMIDLEEII